MGKSPKTSKKFNVKALLNRRVETSNSKALARDIRMPKWLRAIGGYFKGSYQELRQVRWPSRKATWGLTFAVIIFTAVLVVFIVVLDYGFEQLFKQVIL